MKPAPVRPTKNTPLGRFTRLTPTTQRVAFSIPLPMKISLLIFIFAGMLGLTGCGAKKSEASAAKPAITAPILAQANVMKYGGSDGRAIRS